MAEVDLSAWPELTEAQTAYVNFIAARADTDVPNSRYVVGTYEFDDASIELLTKCLVYRLFFRDRELYEASIIHVAPDNTTEFARISFELAYPYDESDTYPPFMISAGDNDDFYYETDEQMMIRLHKLEMLEQSGILKRITTNPDDHT